MAGLRKKDTASRDGRHPDLPGIVVAALLLNFATFIEAAAADTALSAPDAVCLGCHAIEGLEKQLANGERLSLFVSGEAFAKSVHGALGCSTCHAYIDLGTHPAATRDIRSARQYSVERAESCRLCHSDAYEQYRGSLHAARVRENHRFAPVCTGCHGSHSVTPRTAYQTCVGCHAADLSAHSKWLPNAGLHQEVVSCAACHAPAAARMIDLRLYDRASKSWATELRARTPFEQLARAADTDGNGLDARELRNLLHEINRYSTVAPKTLRGRIELRNDVEAHRLADKSHAIRACDNCHRYGAEPFQTVAVSVAGPDGRRIRYPVQREALGSALAMESLPEFYAIGGTRSPVLDALLALALLGGIGVPVGHMTTKWLFRKYRARRDSSGGNDISGVQGK
jgi:Cytochrome c554 and c-prime